MKSIAIIAIACIGFGAGAAHAESASQAFYRGCLAQAASEHAYCSRASHGHPACAWEYRQEKDRCWNSFMEMGRDDPYYAWPGGGAVRFEPVPIPQRPVYILPGMK